MSATFLDPALCEGNPPPEPLAATTDLESTTDLRGEHTSDLAPATTDSESPAKIVATPLVEAPRAPSGPPTSDMPAVPLPTPPRPQSAQILRPGAVLCNRYILERVIGRGGTAVVYQARDMTARGDDDANLRVALKAARPENTERARAVARLRHEFEHAQRLSHPSIVQVFDLHETAPTPFITMELIEGRLLATMLRDWTMLPRPLANKILRACALALSHAHERQVVHGDFKPGNVFVTRDEQVKIVDFGAAALTSSDSSSRIPAGTPAYASPQVLAGEQPEPRDDIFSFACVAYEMLTGQHPFAHRSSLEAREQAVVPGRAWNLSTTQWLALLSALSWDRDHRPTDVETLLSNLMSESEPISAAPPIQPPSADVTTELPPELMPPQRGLGFFMFIACAIALTFIATQRQADQPAPTKAAPPTTEPAPSNIEPMAGIGNSMVGAFERPSAARDPITSLGPENGSLVTPAPAPKATTPSTTTATKAATAARPTPGAGLSEISFESRSIVTTESSVAAVFVIKRSQPLKGRVRVQWTAVSGTADAGIDFASNASGVVEFADGQAQRAIYVPLRNDLIKEGDETFTVRLSSPQNARLGPIASAQATIRDDDGEHSAPSH